jgi:hypothetical protein
MKTYPSLQNKKIAQRISSAALLFAASFALGCSGGDLEAATADQDGGAGGGAATDSSDSAVGGNSNVPGDAGRPGVSCDERPTEILELNQPIWQVGFKVTLGTLTFKPATPSCSPGILSIGAEFENRGVETRGFEARTLVSSAGKDYELRSGQDIPEVPGERLGKGTFSVNVDKTFSLDDAMISFGEAGRHQAVIPFGEDSSVELLTLEPQDVLLDSKITAGYLALEFQGARVLADSATTYSTLPEDEVRITMHFKAYVTKELSSSVVVSDDAFILKLPDGTSIAPSDAEFETFMQKDVSKDMWVTFLIPFPAAGKYVLEAREMPLVASTPRATAELPFTLPTLPQFGDK